MSDIALMYKLGFCERLASLGIAPERIDAAMEKEANPFAKLLSGGAAAGAVTGKGLITGLALLAGVPLAAGYGAGYLGGRANRFSDADVEALKEEQSIINYQKAIDRIKQLDEEEKIEQPQMLGA